MKKTFLSSLVLVAFLTACSETNDYPADATQSEINMAEMMGISVEELRNQTPEQHMKMMQDMMHDDDDETSMKEAPHPEACEGDGCSCHVAQAPNAPKRGGCGCGKAACNKAS